MPNLNSDLDDALEPIIRILRADFQATLEGNAVQGYINGDKEMITWGVTKGGIPIAYEGPPMDEAIDWAKKHCSQLVTKIDEETKTRLAKVVADAIEQKKGVPGLAKAVRAEFDNMTRYRSTMIARTETANALSEGSMQRMKDMGIEYKEWVRTSGYGCGVCQKNEDAGVIPINQAFPSGDARPPAHPNAVFEGSIFAPYGSLNQIVRSKYSGPAMTIETERVTFTIGPNHPILTWRGWVPAGEIHEGDYLLYDLRTENSGISTVESNLNKVSMIEDSFDSLRSTLGDSTIARARAYFHGDEVFTYGKVEVISLQRNLLLILNSFGIEQLCKCNLSGAYPDVIHVAGCSSCRHAFNSVFSAASSFVSSGNLHFSLTRRHDLPSFFSSTRVSRVHNTSFFGWAFDASTQTGLYNSSGIIVKNCMCVVSPARK